MMVEQLAERDKICAVEKRTKTSADSVDIDPLVILSIKPFLITKLCIHILNL